MRGTHIILLQGLRPPSLPAEIMLGLNLVCKVSSFPDVGSLGALFYFESLFDLCLAINVHFPLEDFWKFPKMFFPMPGMCDYSPPHPLPPFFVFVLFFQKGLILCDCVISPRAQTLGISVGEFLAWVNYVRSSALSVDIVS